VGELAFSIYDNVIRSVSAIVVLLVGSRRPDSVELSLVAIDADFIELFLSPGIRGNAMS